MPLPAFDVDAPVQIRLLGPVRVVVRGAPLSVDTRKAIALLAYLAVTGRPAARETLGALLWPESDQQDARSALRRTLSVLNGGLSGIGIAIERSTVTLRPSEVAVDLLAFRSALAAVRDHRHPTSQDCPDCLRLLDRAVALDQGDFMAGFSLRDSEAFDEWQAAEGEVHRRDLAGALERLARGMAVGGAWTAAVAAGRRWLELDPLHEPAHRVLMAAHAQAGEPGAAIGQYRECVRILDRELGVAPLTETTELYEAIRAGHLEPIRGLSESLTQVEVPARPIAASGGPLVGRSAVMSSLLEAHRSLGGDGRVVVVEGEAGIGKSHLLAALAEAGRASGATVLSVRAWPGEASIPFAVIAGLLRVGLAAPGGHDRLGRIRPELVGEVNRLVPGSSAGALAPGDPFGHARLLDGLAAGLEVLVDGPQPGMIVIDDLHLADRSSLDVLSYLAHRLAGRPILLVVSWRGEEIDDETAARIVGAAGLHARAPLRVTLGRLDRADVQILAELALGQDASPDLVDQLSSDSEGLPLYVAESLAERQAGGPVRPGIPGGVLALLRARVMSVDDLAGQLLAAAAVIGRSFDVETLRLASGRSEIEAADGLDELVRRGLIREAPAMGSEPADYEFTHGRLRDVVYEGLGLARRRLLHGRVAVALDRPRPAADGGASWARIAGHEELAGRSASAAEAHRRAGNDALEVFANLEARDHLSAALALGHPAELDLREALADVLTLLGDYGGAINQLEVAASIASTERLASIELRLGRVLARRGDWLRADGHLRAALDLIGPAATEARSATLADLSIAAHRLGETGQAEQLASDAREIALASDDALGIARASNILGLIERARPDLLAATSALELALLAADRSGDVGAQVATRNSLALVRADAGEPEAALRLTVEALGLCERQGDRHRQAALENNLADLLHGLGRPDEAMDHLKRAVTMFAEIDRLGPAAVPLEPEIWKLVEW